jgi:hypothetical protein
MTASGPSSPSEAASKQRSCHCTPTSRLGRPLITARFVLSARGRSARPSAGPSPTADRAHLAPRRQRKAIVPVPVLCRKVATIPVEVVCASPGQPFLGVEPSDVEPSSSRSPSGFSYDRAAGHLIQVENSRSRPTRRIRRARTGRRRTAKPQRACRRERGTPACSAGRASFRHADLWP